MKSYMFKVLFVVGMMGGCAMGSDAGAAVEDPRSKKLLEAIRAQDFGLVQGLIAAGVDVNAPVRKCFGITPIEVAVGRSFCIFKALVDAGASVFQQAFNERGRTLLSMAATSPKVDVETIKFILSNGVFLVGDMDKSRALRFAAENERLDVVELLVSSGISLKIAELLHFDGTYGAANGPFLEVVFTCFGDKKEQMIKIFLRCCTDDELSIILQTMLRPYPGIKRIVITSQKPLMHKQN